MLFRFWLRWAPSAAQLRTRVRAFASYGARHAKTKKSCVRTCLFRFWLRWAPPAAQLRTRVRAIASSGARLAKTKKSCVRFSCYLCSILNSLLFIERLMKLQRSVEEIPYYDLFNRVTEAAAILANMTKGHGSKDWTDSNAVLAMREVLGELPISGRFVSSEGKLDNAARFEYGEVIGAGGQAMDLAVDPIDGTSLCAYGQDGSVSVIAAAPPGSLLEAPEAYMWKIACGPKARGAISLEKSWAQNVRDVAEALGKDPSRMTVAILNRQRHDQLIKEVRGTGAMIKLLDAGDLMPAVATAYGGRVDMLLGAGGGPEGVISAAALYGLGGDFCGRFDKALTDMEMEDTMDIAVDENNMSIDDIVKKGIYAVCITAVTDAYFLDGVRWRKGVATTDTLAIRKQVTMDRSKKERRFDEHPWSEFATEDCQSLEAYLAKNKGKK